MVRSAPATVAVLVEVLLAALGSEVVEVTVAEALMMVPRAVPVFTVTTMVIVDVPAFANAPVAVHVSVPVAPAARPAQV